MFHCDWWPGVTLWFTPVYVFVLFCFTVLSCECILYFSMCLVLSAVYWHVPYSDAIDAETGSVEWIVCVYVSDIPVILRPISFVEFSTDLLEGSCRSGWAFFFFFCSGVGEARFASAKKKDVTALQLALLQRK